MCIRDSASGSAYGTGLGYGTNLTGYGAFKRVKGEDGKDDVEPSLICPNDNNSGKLSKFTVSAVSYTHLDVYKRQFQH